MDLSIENLKIAAITIAVLVAIKLLFVLIYSGGHIGRIGAAWTASLQALKGSAPASVKPTAVPREDPAVKLRLLGLLQRDSRLVDFLMENIQGVEDAQIAAAVREIQPKAQAALKKFIDLVPCVSLPEGADIEVPVGHHPSHFKVTGNVPPHPPYKGVLRHPGWRANRVDIPVLAKGEDGMIIEPTEVEIA